MVYTPFISEWGLTVQIQQQQIQQQQKLATCDSADIGLAQMKKRKSDHFIFVDHFFGGCTGPEKSRPTKTTGLNVTNMTVTS